MGFTQCLQNLGHYNKRNVYNLFFYVNNKLHESKGLLRILTDLGLTYTQQPDWGHCTLPVLCDFCLTRKQKALIASSSLAHGLETCCVVKYNTGTVCGGQSPNNQCLHSCFLSAPCSVDPTSTRQEWKSRMMDSHGQEQTLCCKAPALTSVSSSSSDQWSDISILINSLSVLLLPLWFALVKQLTSPCCTFQIWCSHLTSKA